MIARPVLCCLFAALLFGVARAEDHPVLERGAYEVRVRLEMPHLERWAASRATTICLPASEASGGPPLPVLSANNPLAACPAVNIRRMGANLAFDILCEGRGAARAHAAYTLSQSGFRGRILMIMGGKNMVMTEVQAGRRIGECADSRDEIADQPSSGQHR